MVDRHDLPIHSSVDKVEIQINRLRKAIKKEFDIFPIGRSLAFGDFQIGAEDAAFAGIVGPFLCPIKLAAVNVKSDSYAPFPYLPTRARFSLAGIHKRFDLGSVQVGTHHAHAFAVRPIKFAIFLIELKLLGNERAAWMNDIGEILSVKVGAFDGTIVALGWPMLVQ